MTPQPSNVVYLEPGEPGPDTTLQEFAELVETRVGLARNEERQRWARAVTLLARLMEYPTFDVEELYKRLEALREEAKPRG